jgi:hypothetical protein
MLFILLTAITQVGGIVLLCCLIIFKRLNKILSPGLKSKVYKSLFFLGVYLLLSFTLIPFLAGLFGRVPLPVFEEGGIKPLNIMTCVLHRHYVTEEMLESIKTISEELQEDYPETTIAYLDANFPFINGFPLIPHLSHDDGEKLDLAFFYRDSQSEKPISGSAPSFIGYGVYVDPLPGEVNTAENCAEKGYWQYGILEKIVPQWNKDKMILDEVKTAKLIRIIAEQPTIGKIFLEPHLKSRMKLSSDKIRFHGCHAVRHDDHIHLQLK